jgi:aminopeptidase N
MFSGRLTYNKGASVLHMLRYVANDDDKFFAMIRAYLQKHAWHNATTDDFKSVVEQHLGIKLDTFFQQWIYKDGFPYVVAKWNQINDALFLSINQTSAAPWNVFAYATPLDIKCYSAQGDTTFRIYINQTTNTFRFICDKVIDSIAVDPDSWLLLKNAQAPSRDNSLNLLPATATVYPNPSTSMLYVSYKDISDAAFCLFDMAGRKALACKMPWDAGIAPIDISTLPKGNYIYRITGGRDTKTEGKIRKE